MLRAQVLVLEWSYSKSAMSVSFCTSSVSENQRIVKGPAFHYEYSKTANPFMVEFARQG